MAEKGDIPADTESLPPTYAPSEAYTESPPPAYRRTKSTTVQVARMVCITLLAAAFMIGFFTLTSNYLNAKHVGSHGSGHKHGDFHSASVLPQVEKLVGEGGLNNIEEMKDNGIEVPEELVLSKDLLLQQEMEEVAVPNAQEELDDNIPEEEVEALVEEVAELEEAERVQEAETFAQDIIREQIEEINKKAKLPIDLIIGNPSLAGSDVNCEVERRQQPIGGGIVSQAIIVTCSDSNDNEDKNDGPGILMSPPGPRRLSPPLSFLAPFMKMLSSRARMSMEKPIQIKTMAAPPPILLPSGPRPCSPEGPFPCFMNQPKSLGPFPGPTINGPLTGPVPFSGRIPNPFNGPFHTPNGPFNGQDGPFNGQDGPFPGPSGPFPGASGPFPGESGPFPGASGPFPGASGPFPGESRPFPGESRPFPGESRPFPGESGPFPGASGPFPRARGPFPEASGPFPGASGPFPGASGPFPGGSGPFSLINGPFRGPMPGPNPSQISRHIHIPMNGPKTNSVLTPFLHPDQSLPNGPSPPIPKSLVQGPMNFENVENEPRNRMLPFALRPLLPVSRRVPRILAIATQPNRLGLQTPISSLQRGANNISLRGPKIIPVNRLPLPEAQARALPAPVTLPGLKIFPARLLSAPAFLRGIRRDGPLPITHMEMRKPEPQFANFGPKVPGFTFRSPDFGPPRVDTVISPNQPKIFTQFPPNGPPPKIGGLTPIQIVSKIMEINNRHQDSSSFPPIPKDVMTRQKPTALIKRIKPIAGREINNFPPPPPPPPSHASSIRFPPPPPPPPPMMDPQGRPGIITSINPDAEIISHPPHLAGPPTHQEPQLPQLIAREIRQRPQQPQDDRKHHLLIVN